MADYRAPLRDISFCMNDVLEFEAHYAALFGEGDVSPDLISAVMTEYSKFCENTLAPLYRSADEEGCTWSNGEVKTPQGFKEAYKQYIEGGWPSLSCDPEFGGQGLPLSLALILGELTGSANISFALYGGGLAGAIETLSVYGSDEQRQIYETKLIQGVWNATMCLTEPHCGTDLGLLTTRATPNDDGSYAIAGTKIFITAGEHDLTENIIHLVLARLPDAP
ncbi:MAG: acyl-CoA dehydrogenase family protein, partial [Pseudomonadota bacterium]